MDVRCGRCATEYEFDDALVSERGTTVKCTNCGYQFKVYGPSAGDREPERWVVRTAANRELVYTSLRELQRGIARGQVGPDDMIARGLQSPRPLRSIAELEPLFAGPPGKLRQPRTLIGGVGASPVSSEQTPAGGIDTGALATGAPEPSPRPSKTSFKPPKKPEPRVSAPPKERASGAPKLPEPPPKPKVTTVRRVGPEDFALPTEVIVHDPGDEPLLTPTPSAMLENLRAFDDEITDLGYVPASRARRARSRWIVLFVLVGLVVLLGATVGRDYIQRIARPPVAAEDPRGVELVTRGYALLEKGDLEGAKEHFDKATALSERNPGARAGLAQLETMQADLAWFKLRLLDPRESDLIEAARRDLTRRVDKARSLVAAAFQVAAEEPVVIRARVDLSRLSGEQTQARDWVGPISSNPGDPKNAYTLAALDMAESEPEWKTITERLRAAAAGERGLGRARAALVYALAKSGDLEGARGELDQLAVTGEYPLLSDLKAFVARQADPAAGGGGTPTGAGDPGREGSSPTKEQDEVSEATDFRTLLPKADQALRQGDLERANRLYQAVLARRPDNTEAMAGLAEVARRRNDDVTAASMYERVLEKNPHYLPALMGSADQKWASGDRAGAVVLYQRVVEQAGRRSAYGKRATERIELFRSESRAPSGLEPAPENPEAPPPKSDAGAEPPPADEQVPPPPPPPLPDPPAPSKPAGAELDTTDLPEFRK